MTIPEQLTSPLTTDFFTNDAPILEKDDAEGPYEILLRFVQRNLATTNTVKGDFPCATEHRRGSRWHITCTSRVSVRPLSFRIV